uniref:Neurotransmitter-gated ion-channel ligand-binding domain-containing protein n=1 Tax=Megaselia scalaris TaxID=36166 RepID=T1H3V2_MEGSC
MFVHCFLLGVPIIVKTNMLIRSMGPVSELDMDYSMDCYFRQYWRDKRLSFKGPIQSLSLSIKMLDKIWRPDTYSTMENTRIYIR